jgi:2-polyprenyl-6-methoxyphenol hydroxylase-like FAD-dependent oxidoreductase
MTLALELAHHGVRVILAERNPTTTRHPKMDLTNGRSMELYRRLGIADKLRAVGVPEQNPFDVLWVTRPGGSPLHRFVYPSAAEMRSKAASLNDGMQTLEPGMRISQVVLEPVLKAELDRNPLVDVRFGWAFESFAQDADCVTSIVRNSETGEQHQITTSYLVGCDGGGSIVRRQLQIPTEGSYSVGRSYMVHFRSAARDVMAPYGIVWHLFWKGGVVIAQDDEDTWTMHGPIPSGADEKTLDPRVWVKSLLGESFEDFKVLVANPLSVHMVIAEHYGQGRVWLAGDAVHQVIPNGGYGMNTGVGDAVDLGWKLAAVVNGWGGSALLPSYEAERRPIAIQNRTASKRHTDVRLQIIDICDVANRSGPLDGDDDETVARRVSVGKKIAELGNAENEYWGVEHGYRYKHSSIICYDDTIEPPFDPLYCTPTTWPGARLPHIFLKDGRALYDLLGPEFTLLAIGGADVAGFGRAAAEADMPLAVVSVPHEPRLDILERKLLLVRPDHHVAWRDDVAPSNCHAVIDRVRGNI